MTGTRRDSRKFVNANKRVQTDVLPIVHAWLAELDDSPRNAYLKRMCFSKFVGPDTDPAEVREARAIEKWLATESVNRETNERLLSTPDDTILFSSVCWGRFRDVMRSFIERTIGSTVPNEAIAGSFSGGASTSRTRTKGHPALKYVGQADITESALDVFASTFGESLVWSSTPYFLRVVGGNILFTVPKNTLIDRVCCKEPDLNMYLQKGAGRVIRHALRRQGIDLNDQSRNRMLAHLGSLDGSLATLDLSSASDSVSYSLVEELLPPLWFSHLASLRCGQTIVNDELHECEMFSSMGNGFTFELESLLFWACLKAVAYLTGTKGVISVYGDDLIMPSAMVDDAVRVLSFLGFSVNLEKSYWTGSFRESCGGHYDAGDDITPFFIKAPIERQTDLLHLLNQLRVWAARGNALVLNEDAWVLWDLLSELVPRSLKGGDIVTSGKFQLISPHWPLMRLSEVKKEKKIPQLGLYLHTLSGMETRVELSLRDSVAEDVITDCRLKTAKRWTWHDFGLMFLAELTEANQSP